MIPKAGDCRNILLLPFSRCELWLCLSVIMCGRRTKRILGTVLGLALGDAFGAPYEGGIFERALWRIIGRQGGKCRWTDDTQMTIDVIESLLDCGHVDQDDLAFRFAQSYRWSRGYGPGAGRVLKRIRRGESWSTAARSVYREGSFGNGGAMRAPVVGLFFAGDSDEDLIEAAGSVAEVTHAHPLGREGAVVVALTTALVYTGISSGEIVERLHGHVQSPDLLRQLRKAGEWLHSGSVVSPQAVVAELGNGIAASESCVTSVCLALAFQNGSFEDLLGFAIKLGGDVDTIAAMACAIWGAARGLDELPGDKLEQLEQRERITQLADSLAAAVNSRLEL